MIFARTVAIALALAFAPSEPVPPSAKPEPTTEPTTEPTPAEDSSARVDEGPLAVDLVLPCGLRVIAAQDSSLPVAAVVLAVETGTEDDPADAPGLVHALAYHLLQGNRELAPHGVAQLVHDGGGVTALAIGPAQIRYESLVPASLLDDALWAESQRLRAPTVTEPLWKDTLRWARRDVARDWLVPAAARAAIHGVDGLAHEGHDVPADLGGLGTRAISTALAERFTVDRATLVVVAPMSADLVLNRVLPLFSDLPAAERRARDRTTPVRSGSAPRELTIRGAGNVIAWPIHGDADGLAAADAMCRAIQRQRRAPEEPARAKLKCSIDEDPRRGILVLKAGGVEDPVAFVAARLERLRTTDLSVLTTQREQAREDLAVRLHTPLALARRLAAVAPVGRDGKTPPMRPLAELSGAASLAAPLDPPPATTPWPPEMAALLDIGAAVRLIDAGGAK